ncbi:MAG: hypothetical protein WD278_18520 [Pirellulales bacterium]
MALLAFLLRLGVVWALSATHAAPVTYEHGEIAENLLAGRGFSTRFLGTFGPTSQQAPLYPAMLAGLYWLLGPGSDAALLAMQVLQCAAGTVVVLAAAWLAWSLMPATRTLGWIAGIGAALYPAHLYMVTHIQVAVWSAACLTLLLALAASGWTAGRVKALSMGLLSGVLLLLDPILVLALPVVAVMLCLPPRSASLETRRCAWIVPSLGRLAIMTAATLIVISPWLWRNHRVHGELVFIKSTLGYAFWQGNNPASWGTDKIPKPSVKELLRAHDGTLAGMDRALWEARHETLYIDDVLLAPSGYREFAGLTEPARSRLLAARAWRFIASHPIRYARLCAQRLRYFLLFDETNPKAANRLYRAATVTWLVLALVGLLAARSHWCRLWPTMLIFGSLTVFHALTIVSARFRIPIEPMSFVWAAAAVTAPLESIGARIRNAWRAARRPLVKPGHGLRGPHRKAAPRSPVADVAGRVR